jgi:hypothetical protein
VALTFLNPPTFSTGGVLSASKVNHMLTDIDTLYGWHYGPWYGCDQQQYDTTQLDSTVEGWAGWLILAGNDTLPMVPLRTGSGYEYLNDDDV